jgi:hypothetical protein
VSALSPKAGCFDQNKSYQTGDEQKNSDDGRDVE